MNHSIVCGVDGADASVAAARVAAELARTLDRGAIPCRRTWPRTERRTATPIPTKEALDGRVL